MRGLSVHNGLSDNARAGRLMSRDSSGRCVTITVIPSEKSGSLNFCKGSPGERPLSTHSGPRGSQPAPKPRHETAGRPPPDSEAARLLGASPAWCGGVSRAFGRQRMLDEGRYASISEMARAERMGWGFLGRLLRLAPLSPDLVDTVL